jgi:hypothetical protein
MESVAMVTISTTESYPLRSESLVASGPGSVSALDNGMVSLDHGHFQSSPNLVLVPLTPFPDSTQKVPKPLTFYKHKSKVSLSKIEVGLLVGKVAHVPALCGDLGFLRRGFPQLKYVSDSILFGVGELKISVVGFPPKDCLLKSKQLSSPMLTTLYLGRAS